MVGRVWALGAGWFFALGGCHALTASFDGLPCDEQGRCLSGYTCNPMTSLCAPLITLACDGSGVCPSAVVAGDACPSPGTFIPCGEIDSGCAAGCRTCSDALAWGECSGGACPAGSVDRDGDRRNGCECVVQNAGVDIPCNGVDENCDGADATETDSVAHCGGCNTNCAALANVATAACDLRGAPICRIDACIAGFGDADAQAQNGCEAICTPTGAELCDGLDNDCNGRIDDMAQPALQSECNALAPGAHVAAWVCENAACAIAACEVDFWDVQASAPGCEYGCARTAPSTESCDGIDNDCDGTIDNLGSVATVNADCIGQYAGAQRVARWQCSSGYCEIAACVAGYVNDDADPSTGCETSCTPTGAEVCDGINADEDCNGDANEDDALGCSSYYRDVDKDGFGVSTDLRCLCTASGAHDATLGGDCNDANASVRPGATELVANGVDDNCDGQELCYLDADNDGYRPNATATVVSADGSCTGSGEAMGTDPTTDCNDNVAGIRPNATEIVANGIDENCNGQELCYKDTDNDGYRPDATSTVTSANLVCTDAGEALSSDPTGDCDDNSNAVRPNATELCNNVDDDCDTIRDDGLSASACICANNGTSLGYEVCSNSRDDNCNQSVDEVGCSLAWWSCGYLYRRPLTLTFTSATAADYSVSLVFNHAALVSAGKAQADGDDLRIVAFDGVNSTELARVLDPDSSWNSATTRVWFALPIAHAASSTNGTRYLLYYGSPSAAAPGWSEADVFHFADFFDRANNDAVGAGWTVNESTTCDIDIASNGVFFTTTNGANHRPYLSHAFTAFGAADRVGFRFGFNWARAVETNWRVYMQLGNSPGVPAESSEYSINTANIGVNLTWAGASQYSVDEDGDDDGSGPDIDRAIGHEGFGYVSGGTARQLDVVSGAATVEVDANLATDTFDVRITRGGTTTTFTSKAFSSAMSALDTVRFMTSSVDHADMSPTLRRFEYVIVRQLVATEPALSLGAELGSTCP